MKIISVLAGSALLAAMGGIALAQPYGAPIPPDQVLRSQPMPQTTVAPPPTAAPSIPASPPAINPGSGNSGFRTGARGVEPLPSTSRDRVRDCEHQAAVDRVPRGERGGYINNCIQGD